MYLRFILCSQTLSIITGLEEAKIKWSAISILLFKFHVSFLSQNSIEDWGIAKVSCIWLEAGYMWSSTHPCKVCVWLEKLFIRKLKHLIFFGSPHNTLFCSKQTCPPSYPLCYLSGCLAVCSEHLGTGKGRIPSWYASMFAKKFADIRWPWPWTWRLSINEGILRRNVVRAQLCM